MKNVSKISFALLCLSFGPSYAYVDQTTGNKIKEGVNQYAQFRADISKDPTKTIREDLTGKTAKNWSNTAKNIIGRTKSGAQQAAQQSAKTEMLNAFDEGALAVAESGEAISAEAATTAAAQAELAGDAAAAEAAAGTGVIGGLEAIGTSAAGLAGVEAAGATAAAIGGGVVTAGAAVVAGAGAGIARAAEKKNCHKLCAAQFVKNARDEKKNFDIDYNKVSADVDGITKNRVCKCSYNGNKILSQEKITINQREQRGPLGAEYKKMCKEGKKGDCGKGKTLTEKHKSCLKDAPKACVYMMSD